MNHIRPNIRRKGLPGDEEEWSWMYHDVPFPELEKARAQETIVVAACGFSFFPQPIPEKLIIVEDNPEKDLHVKLVDAVELIKCPICADINHNHFGDRPEYDNEA